jgi:DNA adenine methylase
MAIPFLRWAGGKRQLLPVLIPIFTYAQNGMQDGPGERRFFEPFLGGGALFFSLCGESHSDNFSQIQFTLSDMNEELINCYLSVRDFPEQVIRRLKALQSDCSESEYYRVRSSTPRSPLGRAARLIYLNRLCFNGLYRVNKNGNFNVPYGHLKSPTVCNEKVLRECSRVLKFAELTTCDFETSVAGARFGDVAYFDPPYAPRSSTSNFASYFSSGFGPNDHKRLAQLTLSLTERGVRVVLSNSDTDFTRDCFSNLNLYTVTARRNIAASTAGRQPVTELIGTNFEIPDFGSSTPLLRVN